MGGGVFIKQHHWRTKCYLTWWFCSWQECHHFNFFNPFPVHGTYFCVSPPQKVPLGFLHVTLSFVSPITSSSYCMNEPVREHMVGYPRAAHILFFSKQKKNPPWSCQGLNPGHLHDRRVHYPLRHASWDNYDNNSMHYVFQVLMRHFVVRQPVVGLQPRRRRFNRWDFRMKGLFEVLMVKVKKSFCRWCWGRLVANTPSFHCIKCPFWPQNLMFGTTGSPEKFTKLMKITF